ncbi:MAG: transcriptional regulator, partial [Tannerellaceae bacterium]|nr:transcriptional regulator [Tannerellaceae bacterium]
SELRLAIMSLLISIGEADFMYLMEETKSSGGNMSVQVDKLNKAGYIEVTKTFKDKRPRTVCKITKVGIDAFEEYVEALKSYINK